MSSPALFTVDEVARMLRVSSMTVRRLIDDDELQAVRIGGQWRIPRRAVERLLGEGNMVDDAATVTLAGGRR